MSLLLIPIILPIIIGGTLLVSPQIKNRNILAIVCNIALFLCGLFTLAICMGWVPVNTQEVLYLNNTIAIAFSVDSIGAMFALLVTFVWILCSIYAAIYMKHEHNEQRFWAFYLIVYGVVIGLDFSANLITFYLFYELMTLMSFPLVVHNRSKEAIMAGLKYLFYSFCGAYFVLFGIYYLTQYANTNVLTFAPGGIIDTFVAQGNENFLYVIAFCMLIGFGVKAGGFPMHAWLTAAHPVAPTPASAVLSGIIVKAGVLGIVRVLYFIFGVDFLAGTWVQITWIVICLITVFMGSMLALRTPVLKKRLAYSTISQVSYILLGLSFMNEISFTGSMVQVIVHAVVKSALFLSAGTIIYRTGKTTVQEFDGIGKQMPILMALFSMASISLIGMPPLGGFVSKWFLGLGALNAELGLLSYIAPVVLIMSALLTAGYLFPISIKAYYPKEEVMIEKNEAPIGMLIPIAILIIAALFIGCYPEPLLEFIKACNIGL